MAIEIDKLDTTREWRVEKIEITGNSKFSEADLLSEMLTEVKPWYLFWQADNVFDPVAFREDLERLRRFYEARGYYRTQIKHDIIPDFETSLL
ncbi:MAG: POTRA domain-containing protein, partial [Candidatus Binatia bacterium]